MEKTKLQFFSLFCGENSLFWFFNLFLFFFPPRKQRKRHVFSTSRNIALPTRLASSLYIKPRRDTNEIHHLNKPTVTASKERERKNGAKSVRTSLCFTKASSGNAHREGRCLRDRPRRSHERRTQTACLSRITGSFLDLLCFFLSI